MRPTINQAIIIDGRKWLITAIDTYLEIFHVQEVGRNFKTLIGFEELTN